ncbi:hypothetical protein L7F22_009821 [Adiantum nelumboides]|nr:hypothetical protein [Adiantum nelumboides]
MSPQTETKASVGFKAGVKDYRLTYYTPRYNTKVTDILTATRMTPQSGVPAKEAGAAVAAEASTATASILPKIGYPCRASSPVALGSLHVWHILALTKIFGDDSDLEFGGGTLRHPWENAHRAVAN